MAETGVLNAIVERKRRDVSVRLAGSSLEALRASAAPTTRSLRAALARPGARFVMEVKRASPSQGRLRDGADPRSIALAYAGVADAVSVLTDAPFFQGSLDDLRTVRPVFDGPILAKDFIVDPRQVPEARRNGADAVLAMLSVLGPAEAQNVIAEAKRLGMDVIVEVHDEAQVEQALRLDAPIIGINNRDLRTLEVDLAVTERLAPLIPADRLVVAESGIRDRADIDRLASHADAFLVGTSLMRAPDPSRAARALAFGRVKLCGLTSAADAGLAAGRATYGGMIFVAESPRRLTRTAARPVAEAAATLGLATVGVFRNTKVLEVASAAQALALDVVQLHGQEDPDYIFALRNLIGAGTEIWAVSAVGADDPQHRTGADRTIFDTERDGRSGGTGRVFDWSRLGNRAALHRDVVAGGLSAANARAAARLGAYALDVNSGVESAPGRKDPAKVEAFFDALRAPKRTEVASCA
ncbi:MAG TPA: bifunctional indole-3-glycerol-phosphate synthase TrpC/phosphoribosylanthranilate isomerase TrpF [Allosphingosinicella sp.]|nr:bifunctional indole-3-glycerol-phosphate synthase TrpC/phosphoribosylanthranilate isomerase TrpF [Allosphingosinicella sp.]